jgi:hypothetical protein
MKIGDLVRVRAHTRWSAIEQDEQEVPGDVIDWGLGVIVDLYTLDSPPTSGPHFKVQFEAEYCWFEDFELEVISES